MANSLFSNHIDSTTSVEINRSPESSKSGTALKVVMGENTTGTAIEMNCNGNGDPVKIKMGSTYVMRIDESGEINLSPLPNAHVGMHSQGNGNVELSSEHHMTLNCNNDISLNGGTIEIQGYGGSYIKVEESPFLLQTEDSGDITIDAGDELNFKDISNNTLTLSQSNERTLDKTGTGEVFENVSSIIGALNALARALDA